MPAVYWLAVNATPQFGLFGWKTSTDHFSDYAVFNPGGQGDWQKLTDSQGSSWNLDLAFALTTATSQCPPPSINCTNRTVQCGAWTPVPPWAWDNCCNSMLTPTLLSSQTNGACPWTVTLVWKATDCHGQTNSCTQFVTVMNTNSPAITCPSNITVRATSPAGAVVAYSAPTVSGGCSPYTINCVPPSGSTFPIGVTVVKCSVTDVCGGQASCSFTVTVLRQLQKRFYQQNLLPPTSGMYVPPAPGVITFPSGIILSNIAHRVFSAGAVPPPSVGGNVTHSFNSQVEMDVSFDGGLTWQSCVVANAAAQIYLINNGLDSTYPDIASFYLGISIVS